jgi:hypothetical protein
MVDAAIKHLQEQGLDPWINQAEQRGVRIPGDELVHATRSAIPDLMWQRDPVGAQALVNDAQAAFGGQTFIPSQFRDWLKTNNGSLRSFYNQAGASQDAKVAAGTPSAIEKAQADQIRNSLYSYIDPANGGAGPREIQERTGNLINLRNAADRRANAIDLEKPLTPAGGAVRAIAPVGAAVRAFRGDISGAAEAAVHPFKGPSDALITEIYRQALDAAPLPQPPQFNPRGLLGPGPLITPPSPDSSGPTPWQPRPGAGLAQDTGTRLLPPPAGPIYNMPGAPDTSGPVPQVIPPNLGSTSTRLLPAPTTPYRVSGVTVPDIMGEPVQPTAPYGGGRAARPPQIEAPQPGQPPLNVLPTGPGAIGPAGTATIRSTESGIRMPAKSVAQTLGRAIIDAAPTRPISGAIMTPDETASAATSPAGTGRQPAISQASPAGNPIGVGSQTAIRIPGNPAAYQARYALRELADLQPSHNPANLQPNPAYGLTNDRNYADPRNAERILKQVSEFDPEYLTSESPTAENGAPIVDTSGNVYAGNSRAITLGRVYSGRPDAALAYRNSLTAKAPQYGLDPQQIARMKQPVLVRELAAPLDRTGAQQAVTDMNKVGTAALTPAEQAIADSRRMSGSALDFIGSKIEQQGPDGTLAQALEGNNGQQVVQRLIDEGLINTAEKNKYLNERGLMTDEGKSRISKLLVGRLFRDPSQLDQTAPELRNKLERITPAVARVTGSDWDITPHIQEAIDLLDEARQRGIKNLEDLRAQQGMFGDTSGYSPEAYSIARTLQQSPTAAAKAFRQYANDANYSQGGTLLGNAPTMPQSFADAFDPTAPQMRVPNGTMQPPR